MDCRDWIALFETKKLLAEADVTRTSASLVLVDGPAAVDGAIEKARSPETLARTLCTRVGTLSATARAPDVMVHFDFTPRMPFPMEPPWSKEQAENLRTHIGKLQGDKQAMSRFAECLHGEGRSTEWPRPILKEATARRALWRHPFFEWQLVHGVTNELVSWTHYPPMLSSVTVVGAPFEVPRATSWEKIWNDNERKVTGEYAPTLEKLKEIQGTMMGNFATTWAVYLLTMLSIGYRNPTIRQWSRQRSGKQHAYLDVCTDVYHQMSQVLYALVAEKKTDESTTVLVASARDEAIPLLLIALHRIHERGYSLRLLIEWADRSRRPIDLTATYNALRQHLSEARSFTVPDLCLAMLMQGLRGIGARPCETSAELVWNALHLEYMESGRILNLFNTRNEKDDVFVAHTAVSPPERAPCFEWCATHFSLRNFATAVLAVSAHCLLVAVGRAPSEPRLSRAERQSDAVIQRFYLESQTALPGAWQVAPPLTPMEALARARRANWLFEYAMCASFPNHFAARVRDAAFHVVQEDKSVWGFTWIPEHTLIEEEKLVDALFSNHFRLRPRPNRKVALDFGRIQLSHVVVL